MNDCGMYVERIKCSSLEYGQGDLRITYCPFCGSSNLFAAIAEGITICQCGMRFEVAAYRVWNDSEEADE